MSHIPNILIVDDRPENLFALEQVLRRLPEEVKILRATSGNEALTQVLEHQFALAILDVQMPEMNGYELANLMAEDEQGAKVPIIFLSAIYSDDLHIYKGYLSGAVDFLAKPFREEILLAKVRVFLQLAKNQARLEELLKDISHKNQALEEEILRRQQYEQELIQSKEAAEQANRSKSEFVANMSHEIRTPMNTVLGFTDLLLTIVKDQEQQTYLDAIKAGAKGLLTLINDILDLSKIEAGKLEIRPQPADCRKVMQELEQLFLLKMQETHLEFLIEIDPDLPACLLLDEVRLRQILVNLVGNAVKFTHQGGIQVQVACRFPREASDWLDLVIRVQDTGIGIPPDQQQAIFESFHQADGQSTRLYGGTGLGLAISKRLLEMMNGSIQVESSPGQGAAFTMVLQQVQILEESLTPALPELSMADMQFGPSRVLVVDDILINRKLLERLLSKSPVEVLQASNGEEALQLMRQSPPDLVLMDLRMPVLGGVEATSLARKDPALAKIPIVALTASVQEVDEATRSLFDDFLHKPIQMELLTKVFCKFLPYRIMERKEAAQKQLVEQPQSLPQEVKARLPELLGLLEGHFWEQRELVQANQNFTEFEEMGEELELIGQEFGVRLVMQYGKKLKNLACQYDIQGLSQCIKAYEILVEQVRLLAGEKD